MHLLDSARNRLKCIPVVHEVAAGIAVEYFNQVSSTEKAFALVTAGPGLTNIVTAVAGAWLEHRDLLVIGGQVKSTDLMSGSIRQRGIQEIDGVSIVSSLCKEAVTLKEQIREEELKAIVQLGTSGRNGPIFLEVCLDVQGSTPKTKSMEMVVETGAVPTVTLISSQVDLIKTHMDNAQRPVWLLGAGVSRTTAAQCRQMLEKVEIPLITTWHGADRISARAHNYFGRMETWGQRAANLIINQADLVVVFGARLGLQETGFNWQEFATKAKIIHIEIDQAELSKGHPRVDHPVHGDANLILISLLASQFDGYSKWMNYCKKIQRLLPLNESSNETQSGFVSPYDFYLAASEFSDMNDIWVPASSGGANSVAIQALQQWGNQKVVCDNGLASMGYGLSGAIGAAFAAPNKRVWLIEGDGGFSHPWRSPQNAAVGLTRFKRYPQRHALAQHLLLANHLAQVARAQALGQWRVGGQGAHGGVGTQVLRA